MAIILENVDSAPGCAYCRFRYKEPHLLDLVINRCKITWKRIDDYCDNLTAPSKPCDCPAKGAIQISKNTYMICNETDPDIIEGEIIRDD